MVPLQPPVRINHRANVATTQWDQLRQVALEIRAILGFRHTVRSHRFPSIQRMEARGQGLLPEQVHHVVEAARCVLRRQPRYPREYRVRRCTSLCWAHGVSPARAASPRVLTSTRITALHRYYDPSDFPVAVSTSSPAGLVRRYCAPSQSPRDLPRSPVGFDDMPCSSPPEMPRATTQSRVARCCLLGLITIDHPKIGTNGSHSLQPLGLRPIVSLSTLDRQRHRYLPKTRYWVRRATASQAGLPPASSTGASWRTSEFP